MEQKCKQKAYMLNSPGNSPITCSTLDPAFTSIVTSVGNCGPPSCLPCHTAPWKMCPTRTDLTLEPGCSRQKVCQKNDGSYPNSIWAQPPYQESHSYSPIHFLAIHQEAAGVIKSTSELLRWVAGHRGHIQEEVLSFLKASN